MSVYREPDCRVPALGSCMAEAPLEFELLVERVKREHGYTTPRSAAGIDRFESRTGHRLPDELRLFYMHCDGARLFDAEYVIPDPDALLPLGMVMTGAAGRRVDLPASWYGMCRTRGGEWVGMNFASSGPDYPVLQCHLLDGGAATGYRIVAAGFAEFLGRALASTIHPFWRARSFAEPGYMN